MITFRPQWKPRRGEWYVVVITHRDKAKFHAKGPVPYLEKMIRNEARRYMFLDLSGRNLAKGLGLQLQFRPRGRQSTSFRNTSENSVNSTFGSKLYTENCILGTRTQDGDI